MKISFVKTKYILPLCITLAFFIGLVTIKNSFDKNERDLDVKTNSEFEVSSLYVDINGKFEDVKNSKHHEFSTSGKYTIKSEDGFVEYSGIIDRFNGRGNDSWGEKKQGYSLLLKEKTDLFNMGEAYGYNLIPGFKYNSFMSFVVLRDIYKEMQLPYAPDYKIVKLYVDDQLIGTYFMTEKMEISPSRFDIENLAKNTQELNARPLKEYEGITLDDENGQEYLRYYDIPYQPNDLTGGYLLELTSTDCDYSKSHFITNRGMNMSLRSNPYATFDQATYCRALWQTLEDVLYSETGYNGLGMTLEDYIDLESFADQWLFIEFCMEKSLNNSMYYYKDSDLYGDGKLHASWMWDTEHSFFCDDEEKLAEPFLFSDDESLIKRLSRGNLWYYRNLLRFPQFRQALYKEWHEKFLPTIDALQSNTGGEYVHSLDWYRDNYKEVSALEHDLYDEMNFEEKIDDIERFCKTRVPYMTEYIDNLAYDQSFWYNAW